MDGVGVAEPPEATRPAGHEVTGVVQLPIGPTLDVDLVAHVVRAQHVGHAVDQVGAPLQGRRWLASGVEVPQIRLVLLRSDAFTSHHNYTLV